MTLHQVASRANKILLCGPVPPHPGGGAIGRGQLAAGFARLGRSVAVIAPITEQASTKGDVFALENPRIRVERYRLSAFEKLPFRPPDPAFIQEERSQVEPLFRRIVAEFRPDVVVIGRETFARYICSLTEELDLPSVLLVRGSPTGHILRGEYPEEATRQLLAEFRKADRILAVAEYMAEGLRKRGLSHAVSIANAIDLNEFRPGAPSPELRRKLEIPEGKQVVLSAANLHPRKRPDDVITAAAALLERRRDVVFVMAGTGVGREAAQERTRELGLAEHFRFPGWVDYGEMPALMRLADVVVMASEAEGMARAYLEAMASERLLIASDIDAARELVTDGVDGRLFPLGDCDVLAEKLQQALDAPSERRELGRRARQTVSGRSVDAAVPRYLAEMDAAVAAHASRKSR